MSAEGLHLTPGAHFIEADEDAMATAIVRAMRHPEPIRQMAAAGRTLVREQYDWSALARKLETVWDSSVGRVSRPVSLGDPTKLELFQARREETGREARPTRPVGAIE